MEEVASGEYDVGQRQIALQIALRAFFFQQPSNVAIALRVS